MPTRTIYLAYDNFTDQQDQVKDVFKLLEEFDTGLGFNDSLPVLIGFPRNGGPPIDLEETVHEAFPELQFKYDGKVPILKLRIENPELFYEHPNP